MAEMTTTLAGLGAVSAKKEKTADAVKVNAMEDTKNIEYTFDVSNMDLFYDKVQA